jgi:hypothetical protein
VCVRRAAWPLLTQLPGADKGLLRLDAKRLFTEEPSHDAKSDGKWGPDYDVRYKSRLTATRHAERDGTAFASVALPSHYAAIHSIFDQLTHRLGPSWSVERMIDFHAGTGSGMWFVVSSISVMFALNACEQGRIERVSKNAATPWE